MPDASISARFGSFDEIESALAPGASMISPVIDRNR